MNLFSLLLILGLFQALLLIVALARKKDPKNKALILLLSIIGYGLTMRLGLNPTTYLQWPKLIQLGDLSILLFGPLFLLFFKSIQSPIDYSKWHKQWPHLLPAIVFLLHYGITILPLSTENFLLSEAQGKFNTYYEILLVGSLIINIAYWCLALVSFKKITQSNHGATGLLTILLILTGLSLVFWSTSLLLSIAGILESSFMNSSYQFSFVALSLSTITIAYQALTRSGFWAPSHKHLKYTNSNLSEEQLANWAARAQDYVTTEKIYLNPSLTLTDLSKAIGINKVMLSQVINQSFHKGFSDWINAFRVNEFITRVQSKEYQHFTYIGIATDCGFNNKATFNKAFKKAQGVTPTAFFSEQNVAKKSLNE